MQHSCDRYASLKILSAMFITNTDIRICRYLLTLSLLTLWIFHDQPRGCLNTAPVYPRLLRIVEQNVQRSSKARQKSLRNYFGHFWLSSKLRLSELKKINSVPKFHHGFIISPLSHPEYLTVITPIISHLTIIAATQFLKKTIASSWNGLSLMCHHISLQVYRLGVRGHESSECHFWTKMFTDDNVFHLKVRIMNLASSCLSRQGA